MALLLPAEVWVHVFGYLSTADKLNVRACCQFFKNLVDNPSNSLWRDTSVALTFNTGSTGRYNAQFWATLRRRKINSVEMQSTKAKDWKQLALSLPALNTLIMDDVSQESLDLVKTFTNLRRLAIRAKCSVSLKCDSIVCQPPQLTHLSLCNVNFRHFRGDPMLMFRTVISQYRNLTSLVYHQNTSDPFEAFNSIICNLPKLKHLSCSMNMEPWMVYKYNHNIPTSQESCAHPCGLTSLEIVDYTGRSLSKDIMRLMPCLQRLAVYYKHTCDQRNITEEYQRNITGAEDVSHLKTWLTDLRQLSALVIVRGPPPHEYVDSLPDTVTSLTLCAGQISSRDMETIAAHIPNLLHLHLDPWPASFLGSCTDRIPQLFPQLRSIRIRHSHFPDEDFLSLHRLQKLERLEILDACARPHLLKLKHKLQNLTNDRLRVITSPFWRDPLACSCPHQIF